MWTALSWSGDKGQLGHLPWHCGQPWLRDCSWGWGGGRSWPRCPGCRVGAGGAGGPVSRAAPWLWRWQGTEWPRAGDRPGLLLPVQGHGLQEAPPAHTGGLCILVALHYTFACVTTSHAGRLKPPRVILGQATITTSFCCGDMTFDCLIAAGFGSGPAAKAVSLA